MKSLLQTHEWAALRESQGWRTHWIDNILVLEKPLFFGLSFLYSPEPDFFQIDFAKFLPKIKEIAQNSKAIFIRLDFLNKNETIYSQKITAILKKYHFVKSFEEIQPEYRQVIDLSCSEELILAQMKQKGRYNIKIAQKHAVSVEKSDNIDDFYNIFRQTARRDGFQIRPKKYFEDLLKILGDQAELLVAKYQNKVLAAAIITYYCETASYLYGASASEHRETMAPYLLHWQAIREAKNRGCKIYDLLAIAPNNAAKHKYAGITRFKEQFGGRKLQTIGSWDLVVKPCWYILFKWIEQLRRR